MLDALLTSKSKGEHTVDTIMDDPFPVLSSDADYADALKMFSNGHMAILVTQDGTTKGILTKSDLVEYMLAELG